MWMLAEDVKRVMKCTLCQIANDIDTNGWVLYVDIYMSIYIYISVCKDNIYMYI